MAKYGQINMVKKNSNPNHLSGNIYCKYIVYKCVQLNSNSDLLDGFKKGYYTAAAVAAAVV